MTEIIAINKELCSLTETSAALKPGLDFKEWCEVGKSLSRASRSLQWWIGDWMNYGVKEYGDSRALAADHASAFGLQGELFSNVIWVSASVTTRTASLSWAHHREVAGLAAKDQKRWLKQADENKWSVSELRQAIRKDEAEVKHDDRSNLGQAYNPIEFALRTVAWFNAQPPISEWTSERRRATKQSLEPIVELWRSL